MNVVGRCTRGHIIMIRCRRRRHRRRPPAGKLDCGYQERQGTSVAVVRQNPNSKDYKDAGLLSGSITNRKKTWETGDDGERCPVPLRVCSPTDLGQRRPAR
jgi:hypothetical protein